LPRNGITDLNELISGADAALFKLINGGLGRPSLDPFMLAATWLGTGGAQASILLSLGAIGLWRRLSSAKWTALAGILGLVFGFAASQIGKHIWERPRPLLALFDVRIVGDALFAHSFPSGHTTTVFAVAAACGTMAPRYRFVLYALAAAVGLSRVYVGAHYPVDVLYGALLGYSAGYAAARLLRPALMRRQRDAVPTPQEVAEAR